MQAFHLFKYLWLVVPLLWFVDIQMKFKSNGTGSIMGSGHSTNKTHTFSNHSTLNETIVGLRDSQGNCIPSPHQPLAKLYHVRKRIDDPRIDLGEAWKVIEVACYFVCKANVHFPHAMQQIYRCFSYWLDYDSREPFLLLPGAKVEKNLRAHPFIGGMMEIFDKQLEVEVNYHTHYVPGAIEFLKSKPTIDIQTFNGIGNYSLRHADQLHHLVKEQFDLDDTNSDTCKHPKPRIAILNRSEQNRRSILNALQLANRTEIKELSRNNFVDVKCFEEASFIEQVTFFRSVDILISPHGAQLTGVAFMNAPCSHVLELFTKSYVLPGFFGSLILESGKDYSYLYMSENPPHAEHQARNKKERRSARALQLCPSSDMMVDVIRKLVDEWRQCCNVREMT